jgi:hypothetical protein
MRSERLKQWSAANWFVLIAPILIALAWLIGRSSAWAQDPAAMEAAFLIDATVTLPVLYALCYGRSQPLWQVAVRMLAIACLGIYLLSYLIPTEAQSLLPRFAWARTIGLAVLCLIELRLLIAGIRLVFRSGVTAEQLSAATGAPPIISKLMLLEARFWKSVARFLRGS